MKRKLCILFLSLCVACTAVGCGGKGGASSAKSESAASSGARLVSVSEKKMADHVELGEYKGIAVDKSVQEVTEDDIDFQIENTLNMSSEEVEDAEAQLGEGDIANISYVGKKDGEPFEGGTSDDYDLTIGSGQFIEGFEEGLIGAKKGETRDLNLTFPEEYHSEELAGQEVVFTVSVNAIKRVPELTEEWVTSNTESDSIEAYRQSIREELEESNEFTADSSVKNEAWNQVVSDSEIKKYPDEDLKAAAEEYKNSMNTYAEQMGQTVEEFLEAQNITQEELDEESQQYAEYKVKQNLVLQAIMDAEGFSLDDEGSKKTAEQMEKDYGITIEAMNEQYGEASVRESIALSRVMDFIVENAEVSKTAITSDEKDGILTDEDDTKLTDEDNTENEENTQE